MPEPVSPPLHSDEPLRSLKNILQGRGVFLFPTTGLCSCMMVGVRFGCPRVAILFGLETPLMTLEDREGKRQNGFEISDD